MLIVVHLSQQQTEFRMVTAFPSVSCKILSIHLKNPPDLDFPIDVGLRDIFYDEAREPYDLFFVDKEQKDDSFYKMDYRTTVLPSTEFKQLHKKGYLELYIKPKGVSFESEDGITMLLEIEHK